jgi:translation initiation factor 3 subunit E
MAKYDLSSEVGQFLDHHLMLKVLGFLDENKVYVDPKNPMVSSPAVAEAQLELLNKTNMADFAASIHKKLHPDKAEPKEYGEKKKKVLQNFKAMSKECAPLESLLQDTALVKQLRLDKLFNIAYLQEEHNIEPTIVESYYRYAKIQFEAGQYEKAAEMLAYYRLLGTNQENLFACLWGKLAAEILIENWDVALEDLARLREAIESKASTPLEQLQHRSWLMHWGLFVFFCHGNTERGRNGIVDLLLNERYLCAAQTNCPHLLRYLTAAVICNKRRRVVMKDLVRVIQQERYTYTDPITKFLECLYVDFDFDQAQEQLGLCEQVLANDFFLHSMREEFLENARVFIFETYCRIHQKIDITMLAEKLHMESPAEAERWIVNLIRDASLDAKIDSENNHVIMGTKNPSVYQSVIETTENLASRSYVLYNALGQRLTAAGMGTEKMMRGDTGK